MNLSLLLPLLLSHLLGDFLFQPSIWVKHKEDKKHRSKYLYFHIAIHIALLIFTLKFNIDYWYIVLIIGITHFFIDWAKLMLTKKVNNILLFFSDQALHLSIIFGLVYLQNPFPINFSKLNEPKLLITLITIVFVSVVSAVIIKVLLSKLKIGEEMPNNAGKYIGILERLFIFFFVVSNYWAGIGFLLAAKSIFRFGDLTNAKDKNLTEYILIGTLLSFGLAMASAVIYKSILI